VYNELNARKVARAKLQVEQELAQVQDQSQQREKKYLQDTQSLNNNIKQVTDAKDRLTEEIKEIEQEAEERVKELSSQLETITQDRDKWKERIETIRQERDRLMTKIDELTARLAAKPKEEPKEIIAAEPQKTAPAAPASPSSWDLSRAPSVSPSGGKAVDEKYWANLLAEKASLEIDIQKLKDDLSAKSIAVVETKQINENLQLEVDALKHTKEELEVQLQHKTDMVDNISLELARTKNDKKFIADRTDKLSAENDGLRRDMKQLVSVKNALEKSIARLSQEKDKMAGKLGQTETIIQSKIDEIWDIKDDLDRSIRTAKVDADTGEVELPPIVVSSENKTGHFTAAGTSTGFNGRVISINEDNNFVIVDIGENAGVRLGDSLSVYRDSRFVARLEVIQVREDISAADLKDQTSKVRVGDIVR
jgi:chromosome segregation ATPase